MRDLEWQDVFISGAEDGGDATRLTRVPNRVSGIASLGMQLPDFNRATRVQLQYQNQRVSVTHLTQSPCAAIKQL